MEIKLISKNLETKNKWDNFVSSSPNGTIYHKTFWLDAWGGNYDLWGVYKGAEIVASFVVPYKRLLGLKLATIPAFTPYSGIIFKKYEGKYVSRITTEKELAIAFASLLRKRYRWGISTFHPSIIDMQPFLWSGFKTSPQYTYIMDVSNLEQIWKEMHADTRSSIRKAQKDGLSILVTDSFNEVIELVEKTFQRQNIKRSFNVAYKYYDELLKSNFYKGFICIDKDGNNIASYCMVWDENRAYGFLSGYDSEKKHKGSTSLCLWEAIKFTSTELGMAEFDFEGSMIPQVERFYRYFGGKLTPYYCLSWGQGLDLLLKINIVFNKYFKI